MTPNIGKRHWILMVCCIAILTGCSGLRQVAAPEPEWMTQRPQVPGYYIGIATASKSQHPFNAIEVAKQRALSALAGEISVKVEASSVLNTLQQNDRVNQRFQENISSSSEEDLEGFELVSVFEGELEVAAYYRLNKAAYDQLKAERKRTAIAVAAGFYEAGLEAENSRDVGSALDRYVRGLAALEKHWGEVNLWTGRDGRNLAIDQSCLIGINRILNGLSLESSSREYLLSFQTHYRGEVAIQAMLDGGAVKNLPLICRYTRGTLPHRRGVITNADGMANVVLDGFDAGLRHSELRINIDIDGLLPDLPGLAVQALIEGLEAPELIIPIKLVEPVIYVTGRESTFGSPNQNRALERALTSAVSERGVRVCNAEGEADLIIELESDTQRGGEGQGFHTALLTASVQLLDLNGDVILHKSLDRVKGVQLNWEGASQAAYSKASMEIRGSFLQELMESLYQ